MVRAERRLLCGSALGFFQDGRVVGYAGRAEGGVSTICFAFTLERRSACWRMRVRCRCLVAQR